MIESVDITPAAARTPEGRQRIQAAVDALNNANARCADTLAEILPDILGEARNEAEQALALRRAAGDQLWRAFR